MQSATTTTTLPGLPYPPSSITLATFRETPEEYQRLVIRLMSIQAYAEKIAAIGVPDWNRKAPDYKAVRTIAKIIADEARHAFLLYAELEALGISEKEADRIALGNETGSSSLEGPGALDDDANGWLDIIMNHMFLDRAGKFMIGNFTQTSYAPWASACEKIAKDEEMHIAFGMTEFRKFVREQADNPELSRICSRWFVAGMNFFGPPPGSRQKVLEKYGIKRKNNDQLREEFRREVLAAMEEIGRVDLIQVKSTQYPYESVYGDRDGAPPPRAEESSRTL